MQLGTSQSGVFYRDVSCLWTMAGAAMMHLVFTFPAIVLLFVAVTKVMLVDATEQHLKRNCAG